MKPYPLIILLLLVGVFHAPPSWGDMDDHDQARKALEAKEILPLRQILAQVEASYPGQVIEVELEREDRGWIYEIKVLRPGGAITKLELEAKTGKLIKAKSK